jgi:hypothetical protein
MNDVLFRKLVKHGIHFRQHLISLSLVCGFAYFLESIAHATGVVPIVFPSCFSLSGGLERRLVISHN